MTHISLDWKRIAAITAVQEVDLPESREDAVISSRESTIFNLSQIQASTRIYDHPKESLKLCIKRTAQRTHRCVKNEKPCKKVCMMAKGLIKISRTLLKRVSHVRVTNMHQQ